MKRLLYFSMSLFVSFFILTGCSSTDNEPKETVYSNHTGCNTFEYNPLQIKIANTGGKQSSGSVFYLGKKNGKHVFVTNAHVVVAKDITGARRHIVYDKHNQKLTAQLVAYKEIRIVRSYTGNPRKYVAHEIADIAILEADHLPEKFAITKTSLAHNTEPKMTYTKGMDYSNRQWSGCFETVYQGDTPLILSHGNYALESSSGSPVFNQDQEVIGMITASGRLLSGSKKVPLYANFINNQLTTVTTQESASSKGIFAILTPTSEIRKLLNATYGEHF